MTGGFAPGNSWGEEGDLYADTQPATTLVTTSSAPSQVPVLNTTDKAPLRPLKSFTTRTSTTDTSTTTTTSSSSTTTTTTTTTEPTPERIPAGGYSSVRLFLDIQRIVLYRIDSHTGQEYPAISLVCSSGAKYPTPSTGESSFFKLTGSKAVVTRFSNPSRYAGSCLVRYAVQVRGSTWFHSVPYLDPTGRGEIVLRKNTCDMSGYRALGRRASSGCVRMCLSDANFSTSNIQGMPAESVNVRDMRFRNCGRRFRVLLLDRGTGIRPIPNGPAMLHSRQWRRRLRPQFQRQRRPRRSQRLRPP